MDDFSIEFLDHVAIRVKDVNRSAVWYQKVLGLKKYRLEKWGDFPIFMLAGKSGIALFPKIESASKEIIERTTVDHFAFNVTPENFHKAKKRLGTLQINYEFQDHFYFHSIYFNDPDEHIVELTTLIVDAEKFY